MSLSIFATLLFLTSLLSNTFAEMSTMITSVKSRASLSASASTFTNLVKVRNEMSNLDQRTTTTYGNIHQAARPLSRRDAGTKMGINIVIGIVVVVGVIGIAIAIFRNHKSKEAQRKSMDQGI
ncbi:hypothetical protein EG329_002092 [Mollisiaceae sp. DMI_Dod_QoI]|nr:hypothetical protein EG329_002092 [Helotiales sp. DMI_Dod_QoI]